PEILQKLIDQTGFGVKMARTKVKDWLYLPNQKLKLEKPIDIYRKNGIKSIYGLFNEFLTKIK
ncbi:hypothetical protein ACFL0E_01095, partial [Nanoarchaeota archaeon]